MTSLPRPYWQDMTAEELGRLDAGRVIAILPVGASLMARIVEKRLPL